MKNKQHVLAIVVTHTRELAVQAKKEFKSFLTLFPDVKCMAVFGGKGAPTEEDNVVCLFLKKLMKFSWSC